MSEPEKPRATSTPSSKAPVIWRLATRDVMLDRPIVLGILNVTPDSFADAGRFANADAALAHAREMLAAGADAIDVGGESTRPGAPPVDAEEQLRRVLPVIRKIRREQPRSILSIDTTSAEVARAALDAGCDVVNDVTGLRLDPELAGVIADRKGGAILMHSRGGAGELSLYAHADYGGDVAGTVERELLSSVERAIDAGVAREAIVLDPGVGFAKRPADSVAVLRALPRLTALGFPVLVGASRKRMVGVLIGEPETARDPAQRLDGTVGVHVAALALGARLFRVHDVRAHRHALDAAWSLLSPGTAPG